jgi:phosphoglycolate phosphatase
VGHALAELAAQGADVSQAVLVGDRIYDVEGAAAHHVPTIIVEWGYGSPEEAKGAIATVYSADRLRELLLG